MRKQIYTVLVFFAINVLYGQLTGPFPRDIQWMQINTDTLRLVFPAELKDQAQKTAGLIHHIAGNDTLNFGKKPKKINIFLANRISRSNGFVRYAPFHSKFFTMAPQYPFLGTIDWLDGLAIHEYRHVMQLNGGTKGITRLLKYTLGETYWAVAMNLAVPDWFFEGDAIMQETALSYAGRGRFPEFRVRYNSIKDMERPFSYEKMRCGSYRDVVPDHYSLGYELMYYGTLRYGPQLWEKCFDDAVKFKRIFYPFSRSLKVQTGLSTRKFYREALKHAEKESLTAFSDNYNIDEDERIGNEMEFYSYPKFSNGKLYAVKSSYDSPPYIVEIDKEDQYEEKKVFPVGYQFGRYDTKGKYLVWSEVNNHPRRDYVSFSNIYLYDLEKKNTRQLSKKKRYFSPVISPELKHLAVNEADENMVYTIVILDIETGEAKLRLPNPENYFFREIGWRDADRLIVVGNRDNENVLIEINIADGASKMLFPPIINAISDIYVTEDKVLFTSYVDGESGVQELFYVDLNTRDIFRHNNSYRYGTNMPALSPKGQFAYCEKVFNGTTLKIRKAAWENDFSLDHLLSLQTKSAFSDDDQYIFGKARMLDFQNEHRYPVEKYNNRYKMINFHSIFPLIEHPVYQVSFLSEEYLERMNLTLTPYFNTNDNSFGLETSADYGEFYPVISVGMDNRFNRLAIYNTDSIEASLRYNTTILNTSIGLPLNFNRSNYRTFIYPRLSLSALRHYGASELINSDIEPRLNFFFNYSRIKLRSYRSVQPTGSLQFGSGIYNIQNPGKYMGITTALNYYLPGVVNNHGIGIRASFMYNSTNDAGTAFRDASVAYYYARGYGYQGISKTAASMKLTYSLPLVYPDLSLRSIAFMKRIRANLYFDIDYLNSHINEKRLQRSAGAELIFDNVYFRTVEIPMGVGFDYRFDPGLESAYNLRFVIDF